jgi:aspartate aminotransferase
VTKDDQKSSLTLHEIFQLARKLEREGKHLIHLEMGDPDYGPPKRVNDAVTEALKDNKTKYSSPEGLPALRQKIASTISERFGCDLSESNIVVSIGSRQAMNLCIDSKVKSGDEVVILAPHYPPYIYSIKDVGVKPVVLPTELENNWEPDIDALMESINESTRMIIIVTPNNPTGKIFSSNIVKQIAEIAVDNDIFVLSDEVYSTLNFTEFTSILEFSDCRYMQLGSFSKEYGMTGYRMGYVISDTESISDMINRQRQSVICVPEFIQYAGIVALECKREVREYAELIEKRLETACRELRRLPISFYHPDGTFYIFPKIESDIYGILFTKKLLFEKGVCVSPGDVFNLRYDKFFRMTVLQPEEILIDAIDKMEEVLS